MMWHHRSHDTINGHAALGVHNIARDRIEQSVRVLWGGSRPRCQRPLLGGAGATRLLRPYARAVVQCCHGQKAAPPREKGALAVV